MAVPTVTRKLDYVYLLPAFLCFAAFLAGVIPCMWCLDAGFFAGVSVAIFVVSLLAHAYILMRWKHYKNSSPFAYAITQPVAHMIVMTFALCVGSVNVCQTPPAQALAPADTELFDQGAEISRHIGAYNAANDEQ